MMNIQKAAVIGCGFVGSTIAYTLMQKGLFSEMVLLDANHPKAEGEAMDISHGLPFSHAMDIYAGTYEDIADASVVIITAGANQKPGETRLDLVHKNAKIMKAIISEIKRVRCEGILLIVSNPVDILTYTALKLSGMPENRVIGSGTVLDTARLKYRLGEHLSVDSRSVHAFIVGEHGDSEIAVFSSANVSGIPLNRFCEMRGHFEHEAATRRIAEEVKNSAYEIIAKKHATYYGIGMALTRITRAVFGNESSVLTVSAMLRGEYGQKDVFVGVPCIVNRSGIQRVLELNLSEEEQARFSASCETLRESYAGLKL